MKSKSFTKQEKRAIFTRRLSHFKEIIDDHNTYPFHKETRWENGDLMTPDWEYEFYRHGVLESGRFICYAKMSSERKKVEGKIGVRSDHDISVSKYKRDEILKISTKGMFMYPHEEEKDTGFIFIKIKSAEVEIVENTFWWNYSFEYLGRAHEA